MNTYIIQHRIHILSQAFLKTNEWSASFRVDSFQFSQWDFNWAEAHKTEYWLIEAEVQSEHFRTAFSDFRKKINSIIPRVAMISQCYAEYSNEPFLIHKKDSETAFFSYRKFSDAVPLIFNADNFKALEKLKNYEGINDEFYYYWNDMVNVTGYSAKLLLLCSALEALAKSPINAKGKSGKYDFFVSILGQDLKDKMWENNDKGIRHRLIHGEYFNADRDKNNDYLGEAYKKVIDYFNSQILGENLIRGVINPQRHPDGNMRVGKYFLKRKKESPPFVLKSLMAGCDEDFHSYINKFEVSEIPSDY